MKRLPFRLPDFTRVNWVSNEAREYWEPKIAAGRRLLGRLELQSVVSGLRQCALVPVDLPNLVNLRQQVEGCNLRIEESYRFARPNAYSSEVVASEAPDTTAMCVIGSSEVVQAALEYRALGRDQELGKLLGYPACCSAFFHDVWNNERLIDTIWPMAIRTNSVKIRSAEHIEVSALPSTNIFLKCIGIRPVFHLPCACDCTATSEIAHRYRELALKLACEEELNSLYDILNLPLRWSANHGICEIETPIFRVSTKTDSTAVNYEIDYVTAESAIPKGAIGTRFPFLSKKKTRAVRISVHQEASGDGSHIGDSIAYEDWYFRDNGFQSRYFMKRSFEPIIDFVAKFEPRSVFYWSCRNGALLREMRQRMPELHVYGSDSDKAKILRARNLVASEFGSFYALEPANLTIFSDIPEVDVSCFMIGRLEEISPSDATAFLSVLFKRSRRVVAYAHQGWGKPGQFDLIAERFGLTRHSSLKVGGEIACLSLNER